jgi:hypothetical protein
MKTGLEPLILTLAINCSNNYATSAGKSSHLGATTLSITMLSIKGLFMTLNIYE